jgi:methylmalonyl-CoA mutase N-terminal domain/subunit
MAPWWIVKGVGVVKEEKHFRTSSGYEIQPFYKPSDLESLEYDQDLGDPGTPPYTRGIYPTMYRGRRWTMRQYAGFGSCLETNRRFKYLLDHGQTGLSVAFDLPTQMGLDSDDPLAQGEVGRVGVAIDSLADMQALFDGIPLDRVSTSMTINATAGILLAAYMAVAESQGAPKADLSGTIQNDILKEYIARGTYIFPPRESMRITNDIIAYTSGNLPKWNTMSISGYHIREAGATAVQEIAFTLADGIEYVRGAVSAGLDVDDFAPRLSFFFDVHNQLFEEAAKLRAARRLWARVMQDEFGAKNPKSLMLRFHCQTAGCTLTAQQPWVNIPRVTLQALAAVLGGAQSLHTNSFDEAVSLPSESAARLALRTQQVIAEESGVTHAVDPLGGSYYVESLTRQIESDVRALLDQIESQGGMLRAIEKGWVQQQIETSAYRYQQQIESGDISVIGVNRHQTAEETPVEFRLDPALEVEQKKRLAGLRERRDPDRVASALDHVRAAAIGTDNLMPAFLEAVRAYATVGEICGVLREEYGEYSQNIRRKA